jgi:hypothetical protein
MVYVLFSSFLLAQKRTSSEATKKAAVHLARLRRTSLRYSKPLGAAKLTACGGSDSRILRLPLALFQCFSVARLHEMAFKKTELVYLGPHSVPLSIADVDGIRRWTLFESAKSGRVFSVPSTARSTPHRGINFR